jgi:hypothetical protein
MQNVGAEQFDFETFKVAYDTDPKVKAMIKDFNKDGITPKTQAQSPIDDEGPKEVGSDDSVEKMAKRATDLNDL